MEIEMSQKDNHDRPAVVLVSRCFVIKNNLILAIQRSATDNHNPSLWEVPGGKLDEGQDLHDALNREVLEETGLLIKPVDTIAHFESKVIDGDGRYSGMPYVVLFGLGRVTGGNLKLSDEHDSYQWFRYAQFMRLELTEETRNAARVLRRRLEENGVF